MSVGRSVGLSIPRVFFVSIIATLSNSGQLWTTLRQFWTTLGRIYWSTLGLVSWSIRRLFGWSVGPPFAFFRRFASSSYVTAPAHYRAPTTTPDPHITASAQTCDWYCHVYSLVKYRSRETSKKPFWRVNKGSSKITAMIIITISWFFSSGIYRPIFENHQLHI